MKRREDISSCKDMRKKARRKLAGYYKNTKLLFPLSLICHSSQVQKPGKQRYRKPNECLARVLSVSNKCHREAAGFNTFSGSRFFVSVQRGIIHMARQAFANHVAFGFSVIQPIDSN